MYTPSKKTKRSLDEQCTLFYCGKYPLIGFEEGLRQCKSKEEEKMFTLNHHYSTIKYGHYSAASQHNTFATSSSSSSSEN